jgi:hypothetical protein
MEVMPVLQSGFEGTGKSLVGTLLARYFGRHAMVVSDADDICGRFNAILEYCVLVIANELSFAGDHKVDRKLKAFITDPKLRIEHKNGPVYMADNRLSFLLTTNDGQAVRAGVGARRFFMLAASADKADDRAYFAVLHAEIEGGGAEAFMGLLLTLDISGFNRRNAPASALLLSHQLQSMEAEYAWITAAVGAGDLGLGHESGLSIPLPAPGGPFPVVSAETMHRACIDWCNVMRRRPPDHIRFGQMCGLVLGTKVRRVGTVFRKLSFGEWVSEQRPDVWGYVVADAATIAARIKRVSGLRTR